MSELHEIIAMGADGVMVELAEECSELARAALKLVRVHHGRTPVTEEEARANLVEEMGDVLAEIRAAKRLLTAGEVLRVYSGSREKEKRMYERLLGGERDGGYTDPGAAEGTGSAQGKKPLRK